jgi:N-acetylmuramoyl-L-alanine amidase
LSPRRLTRRQRLARSSTVLVALLLSGAAATVLFGANAPQTMPAQHVSASLVRPRAVSTAGTPLDPAQFSPGSCMAFAPTTGNRHLTVFLDAGHGGPDPGGQGVTTSGTGIDEAQLTLPVVMDATALLRAQGLRVVVSRTTASAVVRLVGSDISGGVFTLSGLHRDVAARAICANLAHANALVSLHFNIGASAANAGTETTYDAVRPFAARNLALATILQSSIVKALHAVHGWNVPDDGVVTDDLVGNALSAQGAAYGHLLVLGPASAPFFSTPSMMPGALTEPLFLTDPFEGSVASSAQGQQVIAGAIASALVTFLG